jgi:phosphoglycolate phosphatase
VGLCVFDLDHTLIRTPLDLAAMAAEMRALLEEARGPLPPRPERWRVGELVQWSKAEAPELEQALWHVALGHERRAMDAASLEPGALDAVTGARDAGFRTALWTNNARALTVPALERLGLAALLDLVVTRDDMRALKPDPDGWRVISDHFTARLGGGTASARTAPEHFTARLSGGTASARTAMEPSRAGAADACRVVPRSLPHAPAGLEAVVVGDSWVDGVAAAAAGVPFVAYRAREEELRRWGVEPVARLDDLAALPAWLLARLDGHATR